MEYQLLPRRVEALTGVRARNASAFSDLSLAVTEDGALYSFCGGFQWQLGHTSVKDEHTPRMVDALRNVRIPAAAGGACNSLALT